MRYLRNLRKKLLAKRVGLGFMAGFFGAVPTAFGMPTQDASYVHNTEGTGIAQVGNETRITSATPAEGSTAANNVIGWKDFSVKNGETVTFDSNGAGGFTNTNNYLNIVTQQNTSFINGVVQGGNDVYLVNPSGIVVGDSGSFNVGNLYLSTRALDLDKYLGDGSESHPIKAWDGTNYLVDPATGSMKNPTSMASDVVNTGMLEAQNIYIEGNNISILNSADVNIADAGTLTLNTNPSSDTINGPGYIHIGHDDWTASTTSDSKIAGYESRFVTNGDPVYYQLIDAKEELTSSPAVSGESIQTNSHEKLAGNYMLAKDLDFSTMEDNAFKPIGSYNGSYFSGAFDGMYHTISGITTTTDGTSGAGLFGAAGGGAVIENVGVINSTFTTTATGLGAGAIVGYVAEGTTALRNVFSEGNTLTAGSTYNVGGIVGNVRKDSTLTIDGAYNTSPNVNGGIVGRDGSGAIVTINNAYNTGVGVGHGILGSGGSSTTGTLVVNHVYTTTGADEGIYDYATSNGGLSAGTGSSLSKAVADYSGWGDSISNKGGVTIDSNGNVTRPTWRIYDGKTYPMLTAFMKGISTATYNYSTTYNKDAAGNYLSKTFTDKEGESNSGKDLEKFYDKGTVTLDVTETQTEAEDGTTTTTVNGLELLNVDSDTDIVGEASGTGNLSGSYIVYDNNIVANVKNDNKNAVLSSVKNSDGKYTTYLTNANAYTLVYSGQHGYDVAGGTLDVVQRTVEITPENISRVQEYAGTPYYDTSGSGNVSSAFYDQANGTGMLSEDTDYSVGGTIKETFYQKSDTVTIDALNDETATADSLNYDKNVGTEKYVKMEYSDLKLLKAGQEATKAEVEADSNYRVVTLGTSGDTKWFDDGAITPKELKLKVTNTDLLNKTYDGTDRLSAAYFDAASNSSTASAIFGISNSGDIQTVKKWNPEEGKWEASNADNVAVKLNTDGFSTPAAYGSYSSKDAGVRSATINGLALGGGDADADGVADSWNYYLTYNGNTVYNQSGVQADGTQGTSIGGTSTTLTDAGRITPRLIDRSGLTVAVTDSTGTSDTATQTYQGTDHSTYNMTGKTVAFTVGTTLDTETAWSDSSATGVLSGDDISFATSDATDAYFITQYEGATTNDGLLAKATGNATDSGLSSVAENVVYNNVLVSGTAAGNYMFADPDTETDDTVNYQGFVSGSTADAMGNVNSIVGKGRIEQRTITLGSSGTTGIDKVYDMSDAVDLPSDTPVTKESSYVKDISGDDGGIIDGEDVSLTISDARYQGMGTGNEGRDVYRISGNPAAKDIKYTVAMEGTLAGNYKLANDTVTATNAGTINPASMAVSLGSVTKVYDGTRNVTADMLNDAIANSTYQITLGDGTVYNGELGSGIASESGGVALTIGDTDTVTVTAASDLAGTYRDASVAHNMGTAGAKNVTYTSTGDVFSLAGNDAGNYEIAATSTLGDGSITRRTLGDEFTVKDTGAKSKVYDNSSDYTEYDATVTTGTAAEGEGIVSADTIGFTVSGASFIDADGNTTKNATESGLSSVATGISYTVNPSLDDTSTENQYYNSSTGEYYNPTAEEVLDNYKISSGSILGEDTAFAVTNLDSSTPLPSELIQKRNISLALKSDTPTDIHKVYDGDKYVKVTEGEDATASYLTFDNSADGTGDGYVKYSGTDSDNRLLSDVSGAGDDGVTLNLALSHYDDKNAGTDKTVTYVAQLDATDASVLANYQVQGADLAYGSDGKHAGADVGTTQGYIDKRPITITLTDVNKEYDTTNAITEDALKNATVTMGNVVEGDKENLSLDPTKFSGTYANNPSDADYADSQYDSYAYENRGTEANPVYYGGYLDIAAATPIGSLTAEDDILSGSESGNYTATIVGATGRIEPRTVSIEVTNAGQVSRPYDGTSSYQGYQAPANPQVQTEVKYQDTISGSNLAKVNAQLAQVTIGDVQYVGTILNGDGQETKDATRYLTATGEYTFDPNAGEYESGARYISYKGTASLAEGSTVDLHNYRTANGATLDKTPLTATADATITRLKATAGFTEHGEATKTSINKTYDGTDAVGSAYTGIGSDAMVNYTVTNSTGATVDKPSDGVGLSVSAAYEATGDYEGKDVYYSGVSKATGTFADKLTAGPDQKDVTYTAKFEDGDGASYLTGDRKNNALNYDLEYDLTGAKGTISPKVLDSVTIAGVDKTYDGDAYVKDSSAWANATATLTGLVEGDAVAFDSTAVNQQTATDGTAHYGTYQVSAEDATLTKDAGSHAVGFDYDSSKLLKGADAGNYALSDDGGTTAVTATGDIAKKTLYVGFKDANNNYTSTIYNVDKDYNGDTTVSTTYAPGQVLGIFADASGGAGGVLGEDNVTVAGNNPYYTDANVQRNASGGLVVNANEVYYQGISLTGDDAANYDYTILNSQSQPGDANTLVAYGTIWPELVTASIDNTNIKKVYDGTTAVSSTYADEAGTDTTNPTNITLSSGNSLSVKTVGAEYATKNAGVGLGVKYTLSSNDGNYQLVANGSPVDYATNQITLSTDTGTIEPRAVKTSDFHVAGEAVKTYDGTSDVANADKYISYATVDSDEETGVLQGDTLNLGGTTGTYYKTVTDQETGDETTELTADAADDDTVSYTDRTVTYKVMVNDPNYYLVDSDGNAIDEVERDASNNWTGTVTRHEADLDEVGTGHINRATLTATANSQTVSSSDVAGVTVGGTITGWQNGEDMSSSFAWQRGTTATGSSDNVTSYPVYAWYVNSSGDRLSSGYFGNNYSLAQAPSNQTALKVYSSSGNFPPVPEGAVVKPTVPTSASTGTGTGVILPVIGGPISLPIVTAGSTEAAAATTAATTGAASAAATSSATASMDAIAAALTAVAVTETVSSEIISDTQLTPNATVYQQASKDPDITHGETESTIGLTYQGTGVTTSTEGTSAIDLESQGTAVNVSDLSELGADEGISLDSSGLIGLENKGSGVNISSENSDSGTSGTIRIETEGSAVRLTDVAESSLEGATVVETESASNGSEGSMGLATEGLGVAVPGTAQTDLERASASSQGIIAAQEGGAFTGTEAGYTANSSGLEGFATTKDEESTAAEEMGLFGNISINALDEDEESKDDDDSAAAKERRRQQLAASVGLETAGTGVNLGIPA